MKSKLNCNERPMCNITHLSNDIQLLIKVTTSLKYNYFIKIFHRCWRRGDVTYAKKNLKLLYQLTTSVYISHIVSSSSSEENNFLHSILRPKFERRTNRETTTYIFTDKSLLCSSLFSDREMQYCFLF